MRATSSHPAPITPLKQDESSDSDDHHHSPERPVSLGEESEQEVPQCNSSDDDAGPPVISADRCPLAFASFPRDPGPPGALSVPFLNLKTALASSAAQAMSSALSSDPHNPTSLAISRGATHTTGALAASSSGTGFLSVPVPAVPSSILNSHPSFAAPPAQPSVAIPSERTPALRSTQAPPIPIPLSLPSCLPAFSASDVADAHSFVHSVLNPPPVPSAAPAAVAEGSTSKPRPRAGKERARSPGLHQSTVDKVEAALRNAVAVSCSQHVPNPRPMHALPPRPPHTGEPSLTPSHVPSKSHRTSHSSHRVHNPKPSQPPPRSQANASQPLASPASFTPRDPLPRSACGASRSRSGFPTPSPLNHRGSDTTTPAPTCPRASSSTTSSGASSGRLLHESELEDILLRYGRQLLKEAASLTPPLGGATPAPSSWPSGASLSNARFDSDGHPPEMASFPRVSYGLPPNAALLAERSSMPPPPGPHNDHHYAPPGGHTRPSFQPYKDAFPAPMTNAFPSFAARDYHRARFTHVASEFPRGRDAVYALDPNEIVIPETVISILRKGWWDYIPLDALTNEACHSAAFGSLKQEDTTLGINERGHIMQRSILIDARKEKHMDCSTWKQASDNFLFALRDHLIIFDSHGRPDPSATSYVISSFEVHFKYLKARGDIDTNFPSYLLYCIFVRCQWLAHRHTGKPPVPIHVFQTEVFSDIERKRMNRRVDSLTAVAASSSSRSFHSSSNTSDRSAAQKGEAPSAKSKSSQPYTSDRGKVTIFCIILSKDQMANGATHRDTCTAGASMVPRDVPEAKPASITMPARAVALVSMARNAVLAERYLPISTPLKHWCGKALLEEFGFSLGLENFVLDHTFLPPNHYKSQLHHDFIIQKYAEEIRLGRVSPGYPPSLFFEISGHYRTAPLHVIERTPGKLRITVDHSFPRDNPLIPSVNSCIDSKRFQCAWGTFSECYLLVADAPPGTEVSVFDVESAFRIIPTHPLDRTATALLINGLVHLDGRLNFGLCPAPGIFELVADAIVWIFLNKGIEALLKWVDDFIFFRYPRRRLANGTPVYSYDEALIWSIAEDLGWPWAPEKFVPFSTRFSYIGFEWSLEEKTVQLPLRKRTKYLAKLSDWALGAFVSLQAAESLIEGKTLELPEVEATIANAWRPSTVTRYSQSIDEFLLFCSQNGIPPSLCLPAAEDLLCAFAASFAGVLAGRTIRNKCSVLRQWHISNNLPWLGGMQLGYVIKGAENTRPRSSVRPLRPAVTEDMLHCLNASLDPASSEDACIMFLATTAFWGQIQLGELLPDREVGYSALRFPVWSDLGAPNPAAY
ncbi:hypothetical protein D9615_000290 [Tricholomella constricta]|uniref:Reverse transcriptase domain-containing protein n=1 Tax=Tricholomella constricta TaxID=117010 RepID=A0A8H5HQW0_9AGAR|nr:hypothetical protein D9615_000290 [Tricholomella constricta]